MRVFDNSYLARTLAASVPLSRNETGKLFQAYFQTNRHTGRVLAAFAMVLLALFVPVASATALDARHAGWGLVELDLGWHEHDGDKAAWSSPAFNDSTWRLVDLENLGPARTGWHWYRRDVNVGPEHHDLSLLIAGGSGTYQLFLNGARVPGQSLRSSLLVGRPIETVFPVANAHGILEIALQTRIPSGYSAWHQPQFLEITLGPPVSIEYEREALRTQRLDGLAPSICINLLLCLAGMAAFALFLLQRAEPEYAFLGAYLLLGGISNGLSMAQACGLLPLSVNFLIADPLIYAWVIAQIEFTYSFAGRRAGRGWRIYECILAMGPVLAVIVWFGWFSSDAYVLAEAAATAPIGLLLSALLFVWYRKGNREAGWLILPSLAPAVSMSLYDLGTASITLGWSPLNFLVEPIQIGPIALQLVDVGTLLFLFSIAVVMFFRFSRVNREQARSAAELAAGREIQQHLVPSVLPSPSNYAIEAAYFPAREVGGDFYQVLPQADGSIIAVLGDVSGKGLGAAMSGAFAIGALLALTAEIADPRQLMTRLNNEVLRGKDNEFITCLCIKLCPNGQMITSSAGHLPFYKNGDEIASEGGPPLGLFRDMAYEESRFEFNCGDSLILLSDGVVEARNGKDEEFGSERTQALAHCSARDIALAAQQFGQEDDITVLKLRHVPVEPCAVLASIVG